MAHSLVLNVSLFYNMRIFLNARTVVLIRCLGEQKRSNDTLIGVTGRALFFPLVCIPPVGGSSTQPALWNSSNKVTHLP